MVIGIWRKNIMLRQRSLTWPIFGERNWSTPNKWLQKQKEKLKGIEPNPIRTDNLQEIPSWNLTRYRCAMGPVEFSWEKSTCKPLGLRLRQWLGLDQLRLLRNCSESLTYICWYWTFLYCSLSSLRSFINLLVKLDWWAIIFLMPGWSCLRDNWALLVKN